MILIPNESLRFHQWMMKMEAHPFWFGVSMGIVFLFRYPLRRSCDGCPKRPEPTGASTLSQRSCFCEKPFMLDTLAPVAWVYRLYLCRLSGSSLVDQREAPGGRSFPGRPSFGQRHYPGA